MFIFQFIIITEIILYIVPHILKWFILFRHHYHFPFLWLNNVNCKIGPSTHSGSRFPSTKCHPCPFIGFGMNELFKWALIQISTWQFISWYLNPSSFAYIAYKIIIISLCSLTFSANSSLHHVLLSREMSCALFSSWLKNTFQSRVFVVLGRQTINFSLVV